MWFLSRGSVFVVCVMGSSVLVGAWWRGVHVFAGVGMRAPGDRLCVFFPAGVLLVVPVGAMGQF